MEANSHQLFDGLVFPQVFPMAHRRVISPFRAELADMAAELPAEVVRNDTLSGGRTEAFLPLLLERTGVQTRHLAAPGETALDLAERACRRLFEAHPELPSRLDTLIFCTQSPDYILPPNSCILHGRLGLPESVAAFDVPHACSAHVYGLQLVRAMIESGAAEQVLLVAADTYSRYVHPQDWSARLLFGDGAAATWFQAVSVDENRGILDVALGTAGRHFDKFLIPAGGCRLPLSDELRNRQDQDSSGNIRSPAEIHMSGRDILSFVGSSIPPHVRMILERNSLSIGDIDWFVFHQASRVVLDTLVELLELDRARVLESLDRYGNTVSASIPLTLHAAREEQRLQQGQLALLCGFGAGLSWGSALLRL